MHRTLILFAAAALVAPAFAQQPAANPATIHNRRENQQDRIANGIRNGSMTPGEAARAENRQQSINRQVGADRAANGGTLTPQERQQINHRQNNASRQIYREKHNAANAPR
jgi:hypothetical protein